MLTLAPHCFPNDEDQLSQHTITQAKHHNQEWDIGLGGTTLANGSRAVVCQRTDSPLLWLTYNGSLNNLPSFFEEMTDKGQPTPFGLRMAFAHAISHENWGRGFFLNDQRGLRQQGEQSDSFLLISPHGWALHRDLAVIGTTQFLWSQANEREYLWNSSPTDIVDRLKVQMDAPELDFTFTRRFATLSHEEQMDLAWPCKREDIRTMRNILTSALLAQDELWNSKPSWNWRVSLDKAPFAFHNLYSEDEDPIQSPSLEEARHKVLDFFQPRRDEEASQNHLSLRFFSSSDIYIEVSNPTAHERLEAALEWRDWLEINAPHER